MIWRRTSIAIKLLLFTVVLVAVGWMLHVQLFGSKLLSVQTGSMAPNINKGDLLTVNRIPASQLAVGDVITFVSPTNNKKTITHRVISTPSPETKDMVVTKGDANSVADVPFSPKYVLGKVQTSIPYAGYGVDFVRQPLGLAILIYLPALVVIVGEIRKLSEYYRKMRPYISPQISNRLKMRRSTKKAKLALAGMLTVFMAVISLAITLPARASLTSNSVELANGSLTIAISPPCTVGSNSTNINISGEGGNNNVNVSNSNNQNAMSGNASGSNSTSGNVINTNCTSININITNQ